MQLLLQQPSANCRSMQSTLYANVKSTLGLLEALNYQSLEVVQSRLLCVFYEMGHGILPAASISLATCAKVARSKNLHKRNATSDVLEEERKRTWWMLLNLDRFLSVISGDPMLCTRDPNIDDTYPIDDGLWLQDLKLIDFGIANAIETNHTVNVHRDGHVGIPNYMSAESITDTNASQSDSMTKDVAGRRSKKDMRIGKAPDVWSLPVICTR
ncbi:hypothetical protein B0A54_17752 [Friedmanniomyces endolithicus]|uniref:Protein kinase domain-containing protein n=1 Tax=Friedmanniomyces endolithicus TaxID=329885 RepID=A0A4U0TPB8_9PEZI|nr:hypothetical protein B0A54_17752 [Friedmanniomyces endolithicus]